MIVASSPEIVQAQLSSADVVASARTFSRADRLLERATLLGQVAAAIRTHPSRVRRTTRREAVAHLSGHGLGSRA